MPNDNNNTVRACPICTTISRVKASEPYQHLTNARREMLLAARSLIEICIKRLEERQESRSGCGPARKVEIK